VEYDGQDVTHVARLDGGIGEKVFDRASELVSVATEAHLTVGTAESCTGGLVSGAITAVSGSSAVLRGGVVSYAIGVKADVLGVSPDILDDPALGAVSGECATMMAEGARRVLSGDVAVSVTGIAGPGGAEPGKPVGTVWFGVASPMGSFAECHHFEGSRESVRAQAVLVALGLAIDEVKKA
jgi:nicotinamide-nucleotide amidase